MREAWTSIFSLTAARCVIAAVLLLGSVVSAGPQRDVIGPEQWVALSGRLTMEREAGGVAGFRWHIVYGKEPTVITCTAGSAWKAIGRLSFEVRSDRDGPLFIRFDQSDKKIFLTYFDVSQSWQRIALTSADLRPFGDGATGQMDAALIDRVFLVDLNGSDGDARGERTVWVRDMSVGTEALLQTDKAVALPVPNSAPNDTNRLTYSDLVGDLTHLERLAVLPLPGERSAQWSSYDRRSRYAADTAQYAGWGANEDGVGVIRMEGDRAVLAEMAGPGCITRIWTAQPGKGHVKIYLDGSDQPAIDLPFAGYFDGRNSPFDFPSLVYHSAKGANCYVPIPYQKSCKIVADPGWGMYYHFTYKTFPTGTIVPTFTRQLSKDGRGALVATDAFLRDRLGTDPASSRTASATETRNIICPAGQTVTVATLKGPRAVTALKVTPVDVPPDEMGAALREVTLSITWDDDRSPAVWTPLGDFFGTAPGVNNYRSLPCGMTKDGFYSYWYMPFSKKAAITLTNDGARSRSFAFRITHAPTTRPLNQLGRFHVKWHRDAFAPREATRWMDWTLLETSGRGRYCGVALHIWNPRGHWWGEGDEKFFVDGEKFPSTFGTGSEDYFGYAWCSPDIFHKAFHSQTRNDGENRGHISVNRWHISDSVPFQESFDGVIEKYFLNRSQTLYDATVYWYLDAGGVDPYSPVPVGRRSGYYIEPRSYTERDAIEGEQLRVLETTRGVAERQELFNYDGDWSGDAQLFWGGGRPGDRLTLALPVPKAGKYAIEVRLTKANDYGIVRFMLDGKKIGDTFDQYYPSVTPGGTLSLGTHRLSQGDHKLFVAIVGANQAAGDSYLFGLDWIKIRPN